MSELERDLQRAREAQGPRKEYSAAEREKIRRRAAEIYREYEEEMKNRAMEEMLNEYMHRLYS